MILEQKAPAKLNLGLHVLRKRQDGFHDLETVFVHIPWHDRLRVSPADSFQFSCSDPGLPVDNSNLCVRAAELLMAEERVTKGAALHLEKYIPYGAGLGGGSSDAAHTLRLLNKFWDLNVPAERLHTYAAQLGSDVPFFLEDESMYATGRGEIMRPMLDKSGHPFKLNFEILVVVPRVHVSTAVAFGNIKPQADGRADLQSLVQKNNLKEWQSLLVNDFEQTVFAEYSVIGDLKARLEDTGAGYVAMSGSGSAVFALFNRGPESAEKADKASLLFSNEYEVWRGRL